MEVTKLDRQMRLDPLILAACTLLASTSLAPRVQAQTTDHPQTRPEDVTMEAAALPVDRGEMGNAAPVAPEMSETSVSREPIAAISSPESSPPERQNLELSEETPSDSPSSPSIAVETVPIVSQNAPAPTPPTTNSPAPATPGTNDNLEVPLPGASPGLNIPDPTTPAPTQTAPEPRVLVSEVVVQGVDETLQNEVLRAISTRPGRTTTRSQLQQDINAVYATGLFSNVDAVPEDTPLGVRITFVVQANPVLKSVVLTPVPEGTRQVVPPEVVNEIFGPLYGKTLNLREFQEAVKRLNAWYQQNGYDLAQVVAAPQVSPDGVVSLNVAEGVIENIQVRFLNKDGEVTNDDGQPVRGRTREFIITREIELKAGDVFRRPIAEQDLRRVFGLGIFEDVRLSFAPGQDPRKVVVQVDVIERNTGSIAAGAGISSASGLFGTISYQEQNLGGNNQKLGAELQVGQRELLFDVNFTDPWIAGDPYRTSYTVNGFRRRSISLIFDGGPKEVNLPNGDRPRVLRLGGGVTFSRPLSTNVFENPEWRASLGLQYQRVSIRDRNGNLSPEDQLGNDLSFSGTGRDDLLTVQLGLVRDRRDNALRPTSGSVTRLGVEQSVPLGLGNIFMNRLRGSYSQYIPVNFTNFSSGPQTLAFNLQGGTILGDLPPYEAFSLGGSNSVRGYEEGDVGAGRSYLQASAEYRFPLFSIVGGALFVDVGTDLGTGSSVPGNPAGVRGKPGSGIGYGLGVRVQSPLGPIRIDYGLNDRGDSRIHFGIGERF